LAWQYRAACMLPSTKISSLIYRREHWSLCNRTVHRFVYTVQLTAVVECRSAEKEQKKGTDIHSRIDRQRDW
jgi:hypothetical protein